MNGTVIGVKSSAAVIKKADTILRSKKKKRAKDEGGVSSLLYSCQQGYVENVRKILRAKPKAFLERDRTGKTALHYCCISDNIISAQAADILVMAAPDLVDKKDDEGFTPLHLAVIAGNLPLVTFLLANEADVNAVDNEKHTVVHWASVCGETAALRAVLEAGAPISTPDIHGGYPLHYAAQMCGDEKNAALGLEVLHTLLSQKTIDVSVEDNEKRQPLLWAASAGSSKAILALARAGASVEAADKDGLSALHCAASRGHTNCIDTLLTLCGATTDFIDSNGCTALHYAVTLGHADATTLLLTHGADPNRQDRKGRSPAHCGCAKGQFETVKLLANHNANLWLKNVRGDYPLHDAASSGRRELLKWLLDSRPSQVNAKNNDGRTPLHLAALNDNTDMCKILLDAGAEVNPVLKTSKNVYMTPLDCAFQRGFRSTAKFLQLHGGVPANRMVGIKQKNSSSGISLQIRDDITLCSNSSSESGKESGRNRRKKKRSFRRKMAYKYERMKSSISDSEYEERRHRRSCSDYGKDEKEMSSGPIDIDKGGPSMVQQQNLDYQPLYKREGAEILIYANEVNITDKNSDVRIQQNGEIILKHKEPAEKSNGEPTSKPTRPKSAKGDGSRRKQSGKGETSTVKEDITDKVKAEIGESQNKHSLQADEYSLMSNTSHEGDDHEQLVVQASIHAPPKDILATEVQVEPQSLGQHEKITETEVDSQLKENEIKPVGEEVEKEKVEVLEARKTDQQPREPASSKETPSKLIQSDEVPIQEDVGKEDGGIAKLEPSLEEKGEQQAKSAENIDSDKLFVVITEDGQTIQGEIKSQDDQAIKKQRASKAELSKENDIQDKQLKEKRSNLKKTSPSKISEEKSEEPAEKEPKEEPPKDVKRRIQPKLQRSKSQVESPTNVSEISEEDYRSGSISATSGESVSSARHKSFKVLDGTRIDGSSYENQEKKTKRSKQKTSFRKERSHSEETKEVKKSTGEFEKLITRKSKIPMSVSHIKAVSKSERNLYGRHSDVTADSRIPSLPNIYDSESKSQKQSRSISNMSAPIFTSAYSDYDHESASEPEIALSSASRKKRFKKKSKGRGAKSAGSGYDSSNLIDSGFEPSPRSSRLPKWKNVSNRGVNMTSVTQSIQSNIRRYHLERKIFQHLLDLKRLQIRSGQHNEAVLVKRAIDSYHQSCAATVGAGRYLSNDYSFKSFEKFLYHSLRKIQRNGTQHLHGLPETSKNPLLCTQSTHRCDHAIHAYTGIPCAAYLPKMDHHTIPKIGFECKPQGFLPKINPKSTVTLELCHGSDKQIISLPAERLDQNKRYYVTFTVKGQEGKGNKAKEETSQEDSGHQHSKSI